DRGDVPHEGARQRDSCCIEGKVGDAPPEVELSTPLRERTVPSGCMSCENERCEQRKRFEIVLQGAIESPRNAMQWFNGLISSTRRPAIPALKTGRMGSRHDVDEAEADRECQQLKLDRHESTPWPPNGPALRCRPP